MTAHHDQRSAARRPTGQAAFTLIEVMLALAILFAGLVVLISRTGANIRIAMEAHALDVATELARSKMDDIEEELLDQGFQELDQQFEGDFDEEGWPGYHWKADVIKIELPALGALQALDGDGTEGGTEGGAEGDQEGGFASSPLAGMLGGIGMPGGDAGAAASASFIGSQFELISQILEASIRKVTLTLTWKANGDDHDLSVVCYFTEPAAIGRVIQGGTGYADDSENSNSDDSNSNSNNNNSNNSNNNDRNTNSRGRTGRRVK